MIKAVIFDVGGVLIRTENYSFRRNLEAQLGLSPWESEELVFNSEVGQAAQRGEVTDEALWQWVGQRLKLNKAGLAEFRQTFWAGDVLDMALVDYVRSLRPGYQTAIISNATDALLTNVTDLYPMADAFGLIVGSAYEKTMKPKPDIYLRTLERLGRRPEEAIFIDDSPPNITAAHALGMHAVHFQMPIDLPAELATYGVVRGA